MYPGTFNSRVPCWYLPFYFEFSLTYIQERQSSFQAAWNVIAYTQVRYEVGNLRVCRCRLHGFLWVFPYPMHHIHGTNSINQIREILHTQGIEKKQKQYKPLLNIAWIFLFFIVFISNKLRKNYLQNSCIPHGLFQARVICLVYHFLVLLPSVGISVSLTQHLCIF